MQLNPPTKVFIDAPLLLPVSLICHNPTIKWGLDIIWGLFSTGWPWKKLKKTCICVTDCYNWPQYLPDSGFQWLQLRPTISVHCYGHQSGQQCVEFSSAFFHVTLAAAGVICKSMPNGGIQWLLSKPWTYTIGQCTQCYTGTSKKPSKWPAMKVKSINVDNFAIIIKFWS